MVDLKEEPESLTLVDESGNLPVNVRVSVLGRTPEERIKYYAAYLEEILEEADEPGVNLTLKSTEVLLALNYLTAVSNQYVLLPERKAIVEIYAYLILNETVTENLPDNSIELLRSLWIADFSVVKEVIERVFLNSEVPVFKCESCGGVFAGFIL